MLDLDRVNCVYVSGTRALVADLCLRLAFITCGPVQLEGALAELVDHTRRRIWTRAIGRTELQRYRELYQLISTRLFAGRPLVHVRFDTDLGDGFAVHDGDLENVYFSTSALSRRAA